ncbi:MAG: hypothetical protein JEY99_02305 [Spirochaetales bacterium]|nr:hypothetical protein [Spirochaetales bacterium]
MKTLNKADIRTLLADNFERESVYLYNDPELGPLFDKPVMAVASADDPFFIKFKEIIGPFHWTPDELLERYKPGTKAKSVISWYLPTSERVRTANRKEDYYPALEWSFHRTYGGHMMDRIVLRMIQDLSCAGCKGAAARFDSGNQVRRDEKVGWTSPWSERHAAFTAGLGTFGLSGGLITEKGIAHRMGSVITDLELEPDERPYGDDPFAWCLGANGGSCRVCKSRCPVGSVGNNQAERDKDLCEGHDGTTIPEHQGALLDFKGEYGCGLCQTGVPCEFRNPRSKA